MYFLKKIFIIFFISNLFVFKALPNLNYLNSLKDRMENLMEKTKIQQAQSDKILIQAKLDSENFIAICATFPEQFIFLKNQCLKNLKEIPEFIKEKKQEAEELYNKFNTIEFDINKAQDYFDGLQNFLNKNQILFESLKIEIKRKLEFLKKQKEIFDKIKEFSEKADILTEQDANTNSKTFYSSMESFLNFENIIQETPEIQTNIYNAIIFSFSAETERSEKELIAALKKNPKNRQPFIAIRQWNDFVKCTGFKNSIKINANKKKECGLLMVNSLLKKADDLTDDFKKISEHDDDFLSKKIFNFLSSTVKESSEQIKNSLNNEEVIEKNEVSVDKILYDLDKSIIKGLEGIFITASNLPDENNKASVEQEMQFKNGMYKMVESFEIIAKNAFLIDQVKNNKTIGLKLKKFSEFFNTIKSLSNIINLNIKSNSKYMFELMVQLINNFIEIDPLFIERFQNDYEYKNLNIVKYFEEVSKKVNTKEDL